MSDFKFDTNAEAYVTIRPSAEHGYGHLNAYFYLPDPKTGYYSSRICIKLGSQIGSGGSSDVPIRQEMDLYAVRFEALDVNLECVPRLAKLTASLDKAMENRDESSGLAGWQQMFVAAVEAWGVKHIHMHETTGDRRNVPDTPYFGDLRKPSNLIQFLNAVQTVFYELKRTACP